MPYQVNSYQLIKKILYDGVGPGIRSGLSSTKELFCLAGKRRGEIEKHFLIKKDAVKLPHCVPVPRGSELVDLTLDENCTQ